MKKIFLFIWFFIPIFCTQVNAQVITPAGGWQLDSYQYSEVINSSGTEFIRQSTSYGFFQNGTGQLYRMGAYIMDNGGCSNDYCLQQNTSYVVTFFYRSKDVNFKCQNKDNPIPYLDISYFNATGQKISTSYNDNVSNMYVSCDNTTYTVSVIINFGDLGEISHINGFDLWWDINATDYDDARNRGILYTGGGQFGLFGVEVDTDIKGYLDKIEQLKQNDNTNDKLDDIGGAIGDTNDKLDDTNDKLDDTNDKLDNLEDSLTSETPPDKLGELNDSAGWLPAGPVDSLLNLPFTMLRNINNNLGGSCQPVVLTLPFVNTTMTLPCLSTIYDSIEGLSVWINTISIIASGFILYSYLLKLYKWVDDTLTFRENNNIDNWGGL